jgi:hypothetical protein
MRVLSALVLAILGREMVTLSDLPASRVPRSKTGLYSGLLTLLELLKKYANLWVEAAAALVRSSARRAKDSSL